MKVQKSILMEGECHDLINMFERKLVETCGKDSNTYINNMKSFEEMLQSIVDKAFIIGMREPK